MLLLTPLAGVNHLPIPAMGYGAIALAVLLICLAVVLAIGGARPHS